MKTILEVMDQVISGAVDMSPSTTSSNLGLVEDTDEHEVEKIL